MHIGELSPIWNQLVCLAAALTMSTMIGLERQIRQKSAGLRTHTLVGLGAGLFRIISKFGFSDVLAEGMVRLDPSRVASQIVTGIGFIGAGVVFTRRSRVRGLTTAASIWLTAAIGAAAGAGLLPQVAFVTVAYLIVALLYPVLMRIGALSSDSQFTVRVDYVDGVGALRRVMSTCTRSGFLVVGFSTHDTAHSQSRFNREAATEAERVVEVEIDLLGTSDIADLLAALSHTDGVVAVTASEESE